MLVIGSDSRGANASKVYFYIIVIIFIISGNNLSLNTNLSDLTSNVRTVVFVIIRLQLTVQTQFVELCIRHLPTKCHIPSYKVSLVIAVILRDK
jgi:Na+/glutamate symporter